MLRTSVLVFAALTASASLAAAGKGKMTYVERNGGRFGLYIPAPEEISTQPSAANTHIIFMNKCTGGCTVSYSGEDNRVDHSSILGGNLSAFSQNQTVWNQVMSCMKQTFSPFDVTITDVDPGNTAHLEVMVAGTGDQAGQGDGVLGVAPFNCSSPGNCQAFLPNALVFDFANDPYYTNNPLEICSTAAQEIAHTWGLDHVIDETDPMTYNMYSGMRFYKDNQKCGSDCVNGHAPFFQQLACSGSGIHATHECALGQATQNEIQVITALFGSSGPDTTPPTVTITSPANNASVMPGFTVTGTITDDQAVASGELKLDGTSLGMKTAAPFTWKAPATLAMGSHTLVLIATDLKGNTAMATETVVYGSTCQQDSDCAGANEVCDNNVCIAGPGAQGGLGSPCATNADCAAGSCGDDGTNKYCVTDCDPTASTCPSDFQCLDTGGGAGVCWPGETGGHGGCNTTGGGGAGMILLGLGAVVLGRRRRRS